MKPYAFVLVAVRLVALGFILYWIFSTASYLLSPLQSFGEFANVAKIREMQQQAFIRSSVLFLGSGMSLYIFAPALARLATAGTEE